MKRLLELLDHPEQNVRAIHVAGTNGKGSTIHFIKNALVANGFKTGVFTSPSLHRYTGHFYINDNQMNKKEFLSILNMIYPHVATMDHEGDAPTEFEILTAMAWVYFAKHVDIALIEAGMGGREDTTNCFTPIVSIITNVSLDHMQFIGSTIPEIAYHKAGIIKSNVPLITGKLCEDAIPVIDREIQLKNSPVFRLGEDFLTSPYSCWKWKERSYEISLQMTGEHQVQNAAVAIMAVVILEKLHFHINIKKAIAAIENTIIPGRFEKIMDHPRIILDAAHNPAGIQMLVSTIKKHYEPKEINVLFAAFKDKDISSMLRILDGQFNRITLTVFEHPRSLSISDTEKYVNAENVHPDWRQAIDNMLKNKYGFYIITGSFHFIAEVREYLLSLKGFH